MKQLTSDNFEKIAKSEKGLFVIKFYSDTCMPCKTMDPVVEALDQQNPNLNVYKVDTMASPELAGHFGVRGVPTIAFCEKRQVLYTFVGVTPLRDMQYVVDNIDDPDFRETGAFKTAEKKQDYTFALVVGAVLLIFALLFIFL